MDAWTSQKISSKNTASERISWNKEEKLFLKTKNNYFCNETITEIDIRANHNKEVLQNMF